MSRSSFPKSNAFIYMWVILGIVVFIWVLLQVNCKQEIEGEYRLDQLFGTNPYSEYRCDWLGRKQTRKYNPFAWRKYE